MRFVMFFFGCVSILGGCSATNGMIAQSDGGLMASGDEVPRLAQVSDAWETAPTWNSVPCTVVVEGECKAPLYEPMHSPAESILVSAELVDPEARFVATRHSLSRR